MSYNLAELCKFDQWVVWKSGYRNGKVTKIPVDPKTGKLATVNNPDTWSSFEIAKSISGGYGGLGFVLTSNDPFTFIDLDDIRNDGSELKRAVFEQFNSYCEYSPSNNGLHIIIRGHVPTGVRNSGVEVYSSDRFMTITANPVRDVPIAECHEDLRTLYSYLKSAQTQARLVESKAQTEEDSKIYETAARAKNGKRFVNLFEGRWQEEGFASQSEADFALINIIAFYTDNKEQVHRIFMASALGQRDKARKHKTYVKTMVERSFDHKLPVPDMPALDEMMQNAIALEKERRTRMVEHSTAPQELMRPPGLVGEIADYIFASAARPIREVALIGALGVMAGPCGRAYNISGVGVNQYLFLVANSAIGKDSISLGLTELQSAVTEVLPAAKTFFGPSLISSEQALRKHLVENPSFTSYMSEIGFVIRQMLQPNPTPTSLGLKSLMLQLWTKSGAGARVGEIIYSDKDKDTKSLVAPAFSFFGETTPEAFYPHLTELGVAEGFITRMTILEYTGERPPSNSRPKKPPSDELVGKFASICANALKLNDRNQVINIKLDAESEKLLGRGGLFDEYCDNLINASSKNIVQRELWNRAHLKALKLAGLVAVGVNPNDPIVTLDVANWAIDLIQRDIRSLTERFASGEVKLSDSEGQQVEKLQATIRDWLTEPWNKLQGYAKGLKALYDAKVISYTYLSRKLTPLNVFKSDPRGGTFALKRALNTMCDRGDIVEIPKHVAERDFKTGQLCYAIRNLATFDL